jgi:uncharacterized membrane protein
MMLGDVIDMVAETALSYTWTVTLVLFSLIFFCVPAVSDFVVEVFYSISSAAVKQKNQRAHARPAVARDDDFR